MIPLTDLAVGNATGRADLARRNQMKVEVRLGVKVSSGAKDKKFEEVVKEAEQAAVLVLVY